MIKIYHKDGRKPAKMSKAESKRFEDHMRLIVRTKRDSLLDLFLSGEFYSLPVVPQSMVKNRGRRIMDHANDGWVIPESDYKVGSGGEQSAANSISLWIEKNLVPFGITRTEDYAVVVED